MVLSLHSLHDSLRSYFCPQNCHFDCKRLIYRVSPSYTLLQVIPFVRTFWSWAGGVRGNGSVSTLVCVFQAHPGPCSPAEPDLCPCVRVSVCLCVRVCVRVSVYPCLLSKLTYGQRLPVVVINRLWARKKRSSYMSASKCGLCLKAVFLILHKSSAHRQAV